VYEAKNGEPSGLRNGPAFPSNSASPKNPPTSQLPSFDSLASVSSSLSFARVTTVPLEDAEVVKEAAARRRRAIVGALSAAVRLAAPRDTTLVVTLVVIIVDDICLVFVFEERALAYDVTHTHTQSEEEDVSRAYSRRGHAVFARGATGCVRASG
jgi:hypothetical protein